MDSKKLIHQQTAERVKKMRQVRQQQLAIRRQAMQRPTTTTTVTAVASSVKSGLENGGNWCYLNAVLQCLRHSSPLTHYLLGRGFAQDKVCLVSRNPLEQKFLFDYITLLQRLEHDHTKSQRATEIHQLLGVFNPVLRGFDQQDSQEALNTILQTLHKALRLNVQITVDPGKGKSNAYNRLRTGLQQYESHLLHDGYSAIDEIFGSQFESRLTCSGPGGCGHVWAKYDPYSLVPVEIPSNGLTIHDCLEQFMQSEELEEASCEKCSKQPGDRILHKQFRLWTLPKMLVIQLKRFDNLRGLRKINKFIQAPLKLNITKYVSHPRVLSKVQQDPAALQLYDLRGIICHSGQMGGGHYTAKCFREGEGWFHFDDNRVTKIHDPSSLQSANNYIFFYEMSPETCKWWGK